MAKPWVLGVCSLQDSGIETSWVLTIPWGHRTGGKNLELTVLHLRETPCRGPVYPWGLAGLWFGHPNANQENIYFNKATKQNKTKKIMFKLFYVIYIYVYIYKIHKYSVRCFQLNKLLCAHVSVLLLPLLLHATMLHPFWEFLLLSTTHSFRQNISELILNFDKHSINNTIIQLFFDEMSVNFLMFSSIILT